MPASQIFSFQTRLQLAPGQAAALDAYARLFGQVERKLFARIAAGEDAGRLKSEFVREHGLTARQFNAISIGLRGKISSIRERRSGLLQESEARIKQAEKTIERLAKPVKCESVDAGRKRLAKLHHKRRRLATLQARHAAMAADHKAGRVRLAFGSRKLFRGQFALEANGFASHAEWKRDWEAARSSQFVVIGSKDETAGCQGCVATVQADGTLRLQLRLPHALAGHGKHVELSGLNFSYGDEHIRAALASSRVVSRTGEDGKVRSSRDGTALTYRFLRDGRGWRVFVSVEVQAPEVRSQPQLGAIGVDLNADHLAVAETDRFGNFLSARRLDTPVLGASAERRKAIYGDAAVSIAQQARDAGKPVVIERLDFAKRKAELEGIDPAQARRLSAMAYRQAAEMLRRACFRAGVEVIEVNPAYTSVIGAVNHAQRLGISIHMGAALAIARRGLGLRERATRRLGVVPAAKGGHVAFPVPARNPAKHVWSHWSRIRTGLRAALAEHFRSGGARRPPPPLSAVTRALCASRSSVVRAHGASRSQHCSGDAALKDHSTR